ncbi:MAG: nitronate monooxygenase [Leptospiraceae bacterium]|nr:nitronate monooxygenase [Leptospiraceae bacterium]MDW8307176.1 nitronate monooxygenase [Leptospiraceae bacterium]
MDKIPTAITEMLRIDLPIMAAPMFLVSYPDLVVAVSEAGGIGCFPSLNYRTLEALREGLREIRERTQKPIGVNLILHKEHNPNWAKQFEILLEFKVELIITSLGTPKSIVGEAKSVGAKVFCDVTTLKHARIVAKAGADALVAVAQGAGGHAGAISPFNLIPYLKEETNLPVVAAGGITNGRQMAAAFALGADAVYVGTRFIATHEAKASEEYKRLLIESQPEDIVYTPEISGIPANWLRVSYEKWKNAKSHSQAHSLEEEYKRWRDIYSAGHGVAQIKEILPAVEVIRRMVAEYEEAISTLPQPQKTAQYATKPASE